MLKTKTQNMTFRNFVILYLICFSFGTMQATAHRVSAQVFLLQPTMPNNAEFFATIKSEWQITAQDVSVTKDALNFKTKTGKYEYRLVAQKMPESEWIAFASISWLWKSAKAEMQGHKAYLQLTYIADETMTAYTSELEIARINASLFHVLASNGIGILNADRYLMLDRNIYRETMKHLPIDEAPTYLMVYFGMSSEANKHSGYTYGMHKFNLPEVEIVNSTHSLHEVHAVLLASVSNLLAKGMVSENKDAKDAVKISVSEGVYVQGQTMKISF
jgi:Domain of unknown function (DUF4261)